MSAARTLARLTKPPRAAQTTCTNSGRHATFRVRKKVFAYFLDDHHGDGVTSRCWKAALGENEELAAAAPKRFDIPAYIGALGWAGAAPRPRRDRLGGGRRPRARELLRGSARAARGAGGE